MKRLVLTEIARADLAKIRRYSTRTWGRDQTSKYMDALRDTMKGLVVYEWRMMQATAWMLASAHHIPGDGLMPRVEEERAEDLVVFEERPDECRHCGRR